MDKIDRELLRAAQTGDSKAVEQLLGNSLSSVYRYGMKMCRNQDDAKDVAQETLLAASKSIAGFRFASSYSTWLYTIARRVCLMKRRRRKHSPSEILSLNAISDNRGLPDTSQREPETLVMQQELGRAVQNAMESLEPPQREVLYLRDIEGLTAPEVAEVLGISAKAVKSRLHRARVTLRQQLSAYVQAQNEQPPSSSSCPDVLNLFSKHLENDLSGEMCAAMERHLATCTRCSGACDSLKQTLALCREHSEVEVPIEIQNEVKAKLRAALKKK